MARRSVWLGCACSDRLSAVIAQIWRLNDLRNRRLNGVCRQPGGLSHRRTTRPSSVLMKGWHPNMDMEYGGRSSCETLSMNPGLADPTSGGFHGKLIDSFLSLFGHIDANCWLVRDCRNYVVCEGVDDVVRVITFPGLILTRC